MEKFTGSPKKGEHLLACRNTKNGAKFFKLVKFTALDWFEPGTENLVYLGGHIEIVGICTPTFPNV